jgi:hypothetical protein
MDCQRHILGSAALESGVPLLALPFTAAAPMLFAHVVDGLLPSTNG